MDHDNTISNLGRSPYGKQRLLGNATWEVNMLNSARYVTVTIAVGLLAVASLSAQETVSFELRSSVDGGIACPGTTVDWEIWARVTTPGNEGLALVSVGLSQDAANPLKFDLPPADGVPTGMANFSRPEGISNPGEGGADTGYIGVQRGTTGEMNLVQIGGGQNTFGAAGQSMGTNPYVVANVGTDQDVLLAAGSFPTPTTVGNYTLRIENAIANVLTEVNTPPDFSPVTSAAVTYVADAVTFAVPIIGDLDNDGDVDLSDLAQLLSYYGTTSGATCLEGDLDGDGDVDLSDLAALLGNYGTGP